MLTDLMMFFGAGPGDEVNFAIAAQIGLMLILCIGPLIVVTAWLSHLGCSERHDQRRRRY